MSVERFNPRQLAAPRGFSHAVAATGRVVFLAGQTGMSADGSIVEGGVVAQFEQALSNLLTALQAAGGTAQQLASVTVYIVDMEDYRANAGEIGVVWQRLAGRDYPAMAGVGASRLWDADAVVELAGVAVI